MDSLPLSYVWHPTPVILPGKSHGWRSLVGCSPWSLEESDRTERLYLHFSLSCIREENGNPLQCSCLENPRDGGAWWVAICGVTQSCTWLKQLSIACLSYEWVSLLFKQVSRYWANLSLSQVKAAFYCQLRVSSWDIWFNFPDQSIEMYYKFLLLLLLPYFFLTLPPPLHSSVPNALLISYHLLVIAIGNDTIKKKIYIDIGLAKKFIWILPYHHAENPEWTFWTTQSNHLENCGIFF